MSQAYNPSGNDYHFGGGIVSRADINDDGSLGPERRIGNCSAFELTEDTTVSEHMSSYTKIRELDLAVPTGITRTLTFTVDNFAALNWADRMSGAAEIVAAGAVAGKQDTILSPKGQPNRKQVSIGYGYRLGVTPANPDGDYAIDFSANNAPVVKQGAATLTEGEDYYFDDDGLLNFLTNASSSFAAGVTVTVSYNVISETFEYIESGDTARYCQLKFYEQNVVGIPRVFRFPYVLVTATGASALIADAVRSMQFQGRVLKGGEPAVVIRSYGGKLPSTVLL